ncbi:uncharacterized protein FMAN_09394 [Fusarium mangiferae]|uniref:Uncharacterized protein n=1 Tax=Fusarium mangiferae TaxID=192010 RepID=A0A1L7SXL5_FUSMA|nr:uncharacterized protein FMAN_09394 [Fusarium mangiferae]CVK91250.1 uncharacterized protein FMAN_09394 [Fusarium mangiferae]
MRRVLGPKSHSKWQNTSMMIGWCLHLAETDRSVSLPRPWNATDAELSARLEVWGVPAFVALALLGKPSEESRWDSELVSKWQNDEERILGEVKDFWHEQQDDPSQAGASNSVGSHTEVQYRVYETPYRLQENALGPLGAIHASGGLEDFGPVPQGNLPREEKSSRAGNSRKRSYETEANISEGINGLEGFDNSGYREPSKRVRREGSRSVGNCTKRPHETASYTLDMISDLEELQQTMKDWIQEISSERKQLKKLNKKLIEGGSRSVGNSTKNPYKSEWDGSDP